MKKRSFTILLLILNLLLCGCMITGPVVDNLDGYRKGKKMVKDEQGENYTIIREKKDVEKLKRSKKLNIFDNNR